MRFKGFLLNWSILFLFLTITTSGLAQEKTYSANRVTKAPNIDGILDDEAWKLGSWGGNFSMHYPQSGINPDQQTEFKVLYDDNNLYIAIRLYDHDADKIERRMSRRDRNDGDWVSVGIDSYNDNLTAFNFGVNAAGVKRDLITTNDDRRDDSWDAVYYVKVSRDDKGWYAEYRIPFSQIRFADIKEHSWGFNITRKVFRIDQRSTWQNIDRDAKGWVSNWGTLIGIKGIKPKLDIELSPYTVSKYKTEPEGDEHNPYNDGSTLSLSAGLDGKISLSNDFTLNFTINPDFGQVEADPSEVNLTAFESFFEEKRPFFIEGKNIFNFPIAVGGGHMRRENLFYSRRIGRRPHNYPSYSSDEYIKMPENANILAAFKLSGKTRSGLSVGILESITPDTKARIDNNGNEREETVEPFTNFFLARVQKDYNEGKTSIGGIITATNRKINDASLEWLPDQDYSGGIDFSHYFRDDIFQISGIGYFSHVSGTKEAILYLQEASTRYYQRPDVDHVNIDPNRTSLSGYGGGLRFAKVSNGNWRYSAHVNFRSPGFEPNSLGFIRNTDEIQSSLWASYRIIEPTGWFNNLSISGSKWNSWGFDGRMIASGASVNFWSRLKNYWSFRGNISKDGQYLNRFILRGGPTLKAPGGYGYWFEIESDDRKRLNLEFSTSKRSGSHNHNDNQRFSLDINYRASTTLSVSLRPSYSVSSDNLQYVGTYEVGPSNSTRYIASYMERKQFSASIRVNYNLSPDFSLQFYAQPFIYAGKYSDFKKITNGVADNYTDRFHTFTESEISYDESTKYYSINEGNNINYQIDNPDFNFFQCNSNLVIHWEYIPGSSIYLVWSQSRSAYDDSGVFNLGDDLGSLFDAPATNVFLIKLSYRLVL